MAADNAKRHFISYPRVAGTASRQAHVALPEGTFEREMGQEGFFGPASHLYHRHPPTAWTSFDGDLRPKAFDLMRTDGLHVSPWDAPLILSNAHCRLRLWRTPAAMDHLARNADGDELVFVHSGCGDLYCDFGHLQFEAGDYIVIPRGSLWRIECSEPVTALLIEATGSHYQLPDKGLLGTHAIFDRAMLDVPAIDETFQQQQSEEPWSVRIKRQQRISTVTFPFNPLDAVGWHGDLTVCRINLRNLRPLASHRYHLPPSAHTTFVAGRFVICSFVPRPFETDPQALKVPFFHNNDDYDEVVFYHRGNFFSRDNVRPGMVTFHPSGFTHGPHPKALSRMYVQPAASTDEYAVMIDARDALEVGEGARSVEVPSYVDSWKSTVA